MTLLSDDLIEKAARALFANSGWRDWDKEPHTSKKLWQQRAQIVLQAVIPEVVERLMSPPQSAIDAGETELENSTDSGFSSNADGERSDYTYIISGSALRIYRAVLKEAATSLSQEGK